MKEIVLAIGFDPSIASLFEEHQIEGSTLFCIREANLSRFGLKDLSQRKRLFYFIKKLVDKGSASWLKEAIDHAIKYAIEKKIANRSKKTGAFGVWFTEKVIAFQDAIFSRLANFNSTNVQRKIEVTPKRKPLKQLLPFKPTGFVIGCLTDDDIISLLPPDASLAFQASFFKAFRGLKMVMQKSQNQSRFAINASSSDVSVVASPQSAAESDFSLEEFVRGFEPSASCKEEVLSLVRHFGWKGYDQILREVDQRTYDILGEENPYDLSFEEVFSIVAFTTENDTDSLYLNLNNSLRTKNRAELEVWRGYLSYFLQALSKIPDSKAQVYRGIRTVDAEMTESIERNYSFGRSVRWYGFSSTSTDYSVALEFVREQGIVFEINILSGKDIRCYSLFSEGEVLLLPNRPMLVSYDPKPYSEEMDFVRFVTLTQIDSQEAYSF